jgi:hypothetical protein
MDARHFDTLARALGSRRGIIRFTSIGISAALLGPLAPLATAKRKAKHKRQRRRKHKKGHKGQQKRQYPVFTTCHTDTEELGPIPDGPHPTCQSRFDPDEFVPCNSSLTFKDLKAKCDEAYPACNGDCRLLAEPIVGLGDCPDYQYCDYNSYAPDCRTFTVGPIPGGPYGSCWSLWSPFMQCWSCPGHTPDHAGMVDLCGQEYPDECSYQGQNICFPSNIYGSDLEGVGCIG